MLAEEGQTAESLADDIFSRLAAFDQFNEGHNTLASAELVESGTANEPYVYFELFGFWKGKFGSDWLAGNDDEVAVSVRTDPNTRTVIGTTLGDHQLVGQRRWAVTVKPYTDGSGHDKFMVLLKTEAYERPRNITNEIGFDATGEKDMKDIWDAYLLNMQDWVGRRQKITERGRPRNQIRRPGYVRNPWGPPDQSVPKPPAADTWNFGP